MTGNTVFRGVIAPIFSLSLIACMGDEPLTEGSTGDGEGLGTAVATLSVAGSNFEIEDPDLGAGANLIVDGPAPAIDWASVDEIRREDLPSGQADDSFGQGSKEDTLIPTVVEGSIPPNKSDLKTFGIYVEENDAGKYLHLFWTRVQDPSGTTNMDFEFNQSSVTSANGITPERTPGDFLVVYELAKGGTVPLLYRFTWLDGSEGLDCEASNSYPCWGERTDLSAAGAASGSINTAAIPDAESDGLGPLDARTFGEASIDLALVFDPTKCQSFGSAYLKSRSSDSFSAALKDFIAPQPVDITNCGKVIIRKQTDPDQTGGLFGFTTDLLTDPTSAGSFSLADDGVMTFDNAVFGTGYTVTEDDPNGSGFDLSNIDCSASSAGVTPVVDLANRKVTFDIDEATDTVDCTFTNRARGTIIVKKETLPDGATDVFDFSGDAAGSISDGGTIEVADLLPGTYTSTEADPTPTWDLSSIVCDDANSSGDVGTRTATFNLEAGETVTCTFTNTKRGSIIVEKQTDPDGAPGSFTFTGDVAGSISDGGTITVPNVAPGTYTSTESDPSGAGYSLSSIVCDDANSTGDVGTRTATFNVEAGESVKCTFTNSTGAIDITKTAKNASLGAGLHPLAGVIFNIRLAGVLVGTVQSDANGQACLDSLVPGLQYTVEEDLSSTPGYAVGLGTQNPQSVTITGGATCSLGTPDQVGFVNDPLSALQITFYSLAGPGVTKVNAVQCTGPSADGTDQGELQHGQSATFGNLREGVYNCTIVVDP